MKNLLLILSLGICLSSFGSIHQDCDTQNCDSAKSVVGRISGGGGLIGGVKEIVGIGRRVGRAFRDAHERNARDMRNDAAHRRKMHGMQGNNRGGKKGRSY